MISHICRRIDHTGRQTTYMAYCDWFYTVSCYCEDPKNEDHTFNFFNEINAPNFSCDECKEAFGLVLLSELP